MLFRDIHDENCALLGYYAESSCNFLPTFWKNLLVPFSRVKNPKINPVTIVQGVSRED